MKKQRYQKPEIQVMNIEAEAIMAASPESVGVTFGEEKDAITSGPVDSKGHGFNIWGDDDED